jgi:hypothetical protein
MVQTTGIFTVYAVPASPGATALWTVSLSKSLRNSIADHLRRSRHKSYR